MLSKLRKISPWFYAVLVIGSLAQISIIFPSGTTVRGNLYFWGVQFHDGLWHVSIIQKLSHFSLESPVFAGDVLKNYHYFSNLILAIIHLVTRIPILTLTFKVFPVITSLSIGILTYVLCIRLFKNKDVAIWSVFFVYLGSNLAYILPFYDLGFYVWETVFWVQQPMSIFTNIPYAASILFLLLALIYIDKYLEKGKINHAALTIIFLGILPAIKSFSIVILGTVGIVGVFRLLAKRKVDLIIISVLAVFLSFLHLYPVIRFSDRQFIFEPFWYLRTMMEAPDRVNWQDWALRLQHYRSLGAIHQIIRIYLISFLFFFIGNMGTRLFMFYGLFRNRERLYKEIHFILLISAVVFFMMPLLFLSSGIAWNSIQFMYYFLFICAIYAGLGVKLFIDIINKKYIKIIAAAIIIAITVPVNFSTLWFYYSKPPEYIIEANENQLLHQISLEGSGKDRVLTLPLGVSFVYVSAISGKSLILGDELQAIVSRQDYYGRYNEIENSLNSEESFVNLIRKYNIKWIYIKNINHYSIEKLDILEKYSDNMNIRVYKVRI